MTGVDAMRRSTSRCSPARCYVRAGRLAAPFGAEGGFLSAEAAVPTKLPTRRLPDFCVIGAMKAGTTSLCLYLQRHPDVYMPARKELAFFVEEENWSRAWTGIPRRSALRVRVSCAARR